MRNSTRNYVKLIVHANCSFASMTAKDSNTLMNERYEDVFGLIKCIFNVVNVVNIFLTLTSCTKIKLD